MVTPLTSKIHKIYTPKTLSNKASIFRKTITNSPNRTTSVCYHLMEKVPETYQKNLVRRLNFNADRNKTVEISAKAIQNVKQECGQKSNEAYKFINAVSENFQGQSINSIRKACKVSWENAKK